MDSDISLSEAVTQIQQALHALREGVVVSVMRRNRLQDETARLEALIADLKAKTDLAERIDNPKLAAELREESARRAKELGSLRQALTSAEAQAESAKSGLPEREARLLQQLNDLKARRAGAVGGRIESGASGSDAEKLWERAQARAAELHREASARDEVSAALRGQSAGSAYHPASPKPSLDQSAEAMLTDLERRMGLAPDEPAQRTDFLELDDRPGTEVASAPPSRETGRPAATDAAHIAPILKGERRMMDSTDRVRVAAIGTGGIFRGAHLPCYPDIAQAQLVAFCDPDKTAQELTIKLYRRIVEDRIRAAGDRKDTVTVDRLQRDLETVQICDDISEVIDTVKPDLVDICTQPFLHTPLAIQALEAGINVMCEKPLSRSWLESTALLETIQRTGKFYQHNENWLFDPDYYTVKKLVDAGAIGELVMMFLTQAHGGPEGNPKFWNPDFGGGGALLDNGIHAIGAAWYVAGLDKAPTMVKAADPFGMSIRMPERIIDGRYRRVTVDDDAHILIRFENSRSGAWSTAHVEGSWSEKDSPDTVYIGTTGRIEMRDEEGQRYAVVIDAQGHAGRKFRVSGSNWQHWPSSFYGEILNMVECVRNNEQSIMTAQFGADCSAIVGASYLSEKNGRRAVHLEEFKQFARDIAARYPNDPKGANDALVDELLSAVRKDQTVPQ